MIHSEKFFEFYVMQEIVIDGFLMDSIRTGQATGKAPASKRRVVIGADAPSIVI